MEKEEVSRETEKLLLLLLSQLREAEERENDHDEPNISTASSASSASSSSSSSAVLQRLIHLSRSPSQRTLLAAQHAVSRLLPFLTLNFSRLPTLTLLLKLLRNLCAGELSNQQSFLQSNGVSYVSSIITEIIKDEEEKGGGGRGRGGRGEGKGKGKEEDIFPFQVENASVTEGQPKEEIQVLCSVLHISLQLLGNVCGAGEAQKDAVWRSFFPTKFRTLVLTVSRYGKITVMDPLCMVIYTCSHGVRDRLMDLCQGEGALLILDCIRFFNGDYGASYSGSSDWIFLLLSEICLKEPLLPHLFTHLGYLHRLSLDCSDSQAEASFSSEQVTLLSYLVDLLEVELEKETCITKEMQLPLPRESLHHLKDLILVTSKTFDCENTHSMCTKVGVLQKSLEVFKVLLACEHGFRYLIATELLSNGFIGLCLALLKDLGPPELIKKAIEKHGEVEWTTNNGHVSLSRGISPYKGYRRDIIAILANVCYKNRLVQDEIRNRGGLPLILQQCVVDEDNPFLREWGFWAVRNLLDENLENVKEITEMQWKGSVTPIDLEQRGYKVEMDKAQGRPVLVNTSQNERS